MVAVLKIEEHYTLTTLFTNWHGNVNEAAKIFEMDEIWLSISLCISPSPNNEQKCLCRD